MSEYSVGDIRFYDNQELKFSLRSLEKNAPWINHVYIVADRQVPDWLNTSYEKVTIVDHSEIMPEYVIPCFNTNVLEVFLPFIPKLEEKFLYGNDDYFFGRKIGPEFFFKDGKPIIRVKKDRKYKNIFDVKTEQLDDYYVSKYNSLMLLNKEYGNNLWWNLHHNIDPFLKSSYLETIEKYKELIEKMFSNRFRERDDYERTIWALDAVYKNKAILEVVKDPGPLEKLFWFTGKIKYDSYCGSENRKDITEISRFKPNLFCINSSSGIEGKKLTREFLLNMFPHKSNFEK